MTHTRGGDARRTPSKLSTAERLQQQADAVKQALLGKSQDTFSNVDLRNVQDQQEAPMPQPLQRPAVEQPQVVVTQAPVALQMERADDSLPTHMHTTTTIRPVHGTGAAATARSAIRYAKRLLRAVPKWIMRRSRPLQAQLSRVSGHINAHRRRMAASLPTWVSSSAATGAATTSNAVGRLRGAVRALRSSGSAAGMRLGRSVTRVLPAELLTSISSRIRGRSEDDGMALPPGVV
mmetsp:Transcript_20312/g.51436  ORF Transcript_20312/g.51436 Transcript_20312/m.51436 type:complete len:235 (-) Transcript_20312:601-1305(-)